jgi:hypothetical protein
MGWRCTHLPARRRADADGAEDREDVDQENLFDLMGD